MTNEIMIKFILENKIDNVIERVKSTINDAYDYLDNPVSNIEENEIIERLEGAEYDLKNLKKLLEKLEEEYEKELLQIQN